MTGVEIRHALDEYGRPRPGVLLAVVDGQRVASVARVHGSDEWVGHVRGSRTYVTGLSELSAREWLTAQGQTGRAS